MNSEFYKIIFSSDKKLKIFSNGPINKIYDKTLLNQAVGLKVTSGDDNWLIEIDEAPESPNHKVILPFGREGKLAELIFGRIHTKKVIEVETQKGINQDDWFKQTIARNSSFYALINGEDNAQPNQPENTIGTDDMRNGKANVNVFSLEGENSVYLNLMKEVVDGVTKYNLEVGYY